MSENATSQDAFLNGKISVLQPVSGFRSGPDAVLLASAVRAVSGQQVLELGAGAGVASFCLNWRVSDLEVAVVERNPDLCALARQNAENVGARLAVYGEDVVSPSVDLKSQAFDHVFFNPPYFSGGTQAPDPARAQARHATTPVPEWIDAALRRLRPKGEITTINKPDSLPQMLAGLESRVGDIEIIPIASRLGKVANRIILRARKGAKGDLRLFAPLIMHEGEHHIKDGDSHSVTAQAILRDGKSLDEVISW